MIKHWKLSNFKSVQEETHLDLAPLSILAGANSSGKSTLLQSILVVAQTLAHKTNYPPVVLNGGFIRLGDFSDVKCADTDGNAITIGCECALTRESGQHAPLPDGRVMTSVSCKLSFDVESPPRQEAIAQSHPRLQSAMLTTTFRDSDGHDLSYWVRIRRRTGGPVRDAIRFDRPTAGLHRLRDDSEEYDVQLDDELLAELRDDHPSAQPVRCYLRHFLPRSLIIETDEATESARAVHATLTAGLYRRASSPRRFDRLAGLPRTVLDFVLRTLTDTAGETPAAKVRAGLRLTTAAGESPIPLPRLLQELQQLATADKRKLRSALVGSAKSFRTSYGAVPITTAENPQVVDSTGCNRLFLVAKIVQMSYSCGVISQGSTHGTIFAIWWEVLSLRKFYEIHFEPVTAPCQ